MNKKYKNNDFFHFNQILFEHKVNFAEAIVKNGKNTSFLCTKFLFLDNFTHSYNTKISEKAQK